MPVLLVERVEIDMADEFILGMGRNPEKVIWYAAGEAVPSARVWVLGLLYTGNLATVMWDDGYQEWTFAGTGVKIQTGLLGWAYMDFIPKPDFGKEIPKPNG